MSIQRTQSRWASPERAPAAKHCREDGQATVELALCLPILVIVLAAVVEIGMMVGDQARLWHAAREAARTAVVDPDVGDVTSAAERTGLSPIDVDVRPEAAYRVQGRPLTVTLVYRPEGRVPLLGELVERVELRAAATMRIEQP